MDVVSFASFLLPKLLSISSGEGKERLGLPEPSSWLKMVKLAANIYRKLSFTQQQKLFELGTLPPDFEKALLEVFNEYLGFYYQFRNLLLQIKPKEFKKSRNPFNAFKTRVRELMNEFFPHIKIYTVSMCHPSYTSLYEYWKKLCKIF
jgi:hypothetical protein